MKRIATIATLSATLSLSLLAARAFAQTTTTGTEDNAPNAPPPDRGQQAKSDFMDTRLSFTCTDEDMLRDPKVLPTAPGFHCGRPNGLGVLFFDNYDTRFSGFETLSFLSLYKHYKAPHWDIEGGFVVLLNELAEDNIRLGDGGSYVRMAYYPNPANTGTNVVLVAFPVSADRMRLGYSYRISWGGSQEFFKANPDSPQSVSKNPNAVPGAKLQLNSGDFYGYVGVKSSLLLDPVINEQRAVLAGLAGAGYDITENLRVEANGGIFNRGKNETEDVLGQPVWLYGGSAQVSVHSGMPIGSSIDYALYRNEPESIARLFHKETYPGGTAWLGSSEFTMLGQTLKDPSTPGSTRTQMGFAWDANLRLKHDFTRVHVDAMVRDLAFILHSIPSLPTYWDFPDNYKKSPEIFAAAGADQYFPGPAMTLGVVAGVDIPATLTTPSSEDIPGNMTTSTTLVVRDTDSRSVLPTGESVLPVIAIKGSGRVDFGQYFAFLVDLYYQYDPNTVTYTRDSKEGSFNRATYAGFNQLGFNLTLQARF